MSSYQDFIYRKSQRTDMAGFSPLWLHPSLFPFQSFCTEWAIRKGRGGLFEDCGLGKSLQALVWAENVVRHTNKPVLILTPLAVGRQFVREAKKFDIDARACPDGKLQGKGIHIVNYERLHYFDANDFSGVVADESSILKSFTGATRKRVTRFLSKLPYRLLATATPSPNDYVELGNSSEALGELSYSEMLKQFFKYLDDKGQRRERKRQDEAETLIAADPSYFKKLAYRVAQTIGQWRLKHHAVIPFWRWVASWAKACRKPSDLGFEDGDFNLPPLEEVEHIIKPRTVRPGFLFDIPAFGMREEREERKRTIVERTEYVANLVDHGEQVLVCCHLNEEGDALERSIAGSRQIMGKMPEEERAELYDAFADGQLRVLILKPKLGAWGLNLQQCAHVVTYASHSWEAYKQLVCRCWRFGQRRKVRVDVVATEGEARVVGNMKHKANKANKMFEALVREMNQATRVERSNDYTKKEEMPQWLSRTR